MKRTFTFLLGLLFSVALLAQRSTGTKLQLPESPASRLQKDFQKQFLGPLQSGSSHPAATLEEGFKLETGIPFADPGDTQAVGPISAAGQQRLDSIVAERQKDIYTYDETGNVTSWVMYVRDTLTDPWQPSLKEETSFDDQGRTLSDARYYWDESLQQWVGEWRTVYTLDEAGRTTGM